MLANGGMDVGMDTVLPPLPTATRMSENIGSISDMDVGDMNGMTDAYMTGTIFASIFDFAIFFSLFTYSYQTYVLFFTECSVKTNVMATVTLYGPMVRRMKGKWTLFLAMR